MKTKNKLVFGLLGFLALGSISTSALVNTYQKDNNPVVASAWSGTQTSTQGDYYSSIADSLTGSNLISSLKSIISSGANESYDWARYRAADEAEGDSSKVLLIYARINDGKNNSGGNQGQWNREHTYPQSKMKKPATEDNHIIFADDVKSNSTRGNKKFAELPDSATKVVDSRGNTTKAFTNSTYFEPPKEAKGEVARATMYAHVRYGLSVTNNFDSVETMMLWALEQPVTNRDIYRNNTVHTLQKNRNPFVDNMAYACRIWTNVSTKVTNLCNEINEAPPVVNPTSVSITNAPSSLEVDQTLTLTAKVLPSEAEQDVTYTTSDASIISVSNNVITAKKEGSATITVTSNYDTAIKSSVNINVTAKVDPNTPSEPEQPNVPDNPDNPKNNKGLTNTQRNAIIITASVVIGITVVVGGFFLVKHFIRKKLK